MAFPLHIYRLYHRIINLYKHKKPFGNYFTAFMIMKFTLLTSRIPRLISWITRFRAGF